MILQSRLFPSFLLLVLMVLAAPLHALPDVKFNKSKSLGTWQQFVTSLGLQKKPGAAIYFDTDRLVVGEFNKPFGDLSDFAPENRRQIRTGVGRLVKQIGGPAIVVYDFDEIYTAVGPSASIKLPSKIYLFGRRPAAIVADGQISNWPYENGEQTLSVYACNSCDPDNTNLRAPAGAGRGGDGKWVREYFPDPPGSYYDYFSKGGGGGYGTRGERGADDRVSLGGHGGRKSFSWNVLRPGSSGGGEYVYGKRGDFFFLKHVGGLGGGAVWIKSGGRLDLGEISVSALLPAVGIHRHDKSSGSGGHVVLESPETPQIVQIDVAGIFSGIEARAPGSGGAGVLEFRGTPRPPKVQYLHGNYPYPTGFTKAPVGLPNGVSSLQNPSQGVSGTEWPTGLNPDSTAPEYQIFPRPRPPVPAVTASAPRLATNAQRFGVAASITGVNIPAAVRYRVRPPGATFFGRWTTAPLPAGARKNKSWQTSVASRAEGIWQVEVVADDTKGGRSTGKVVRVTVDRRKPGVEFLEAAAKPSAKRGDYTIGVLVYDYDKGGSGREASGPARVEYRLKRPGATKFGSWTRVALGNKSQYPDWPSVALRMPFRLDPTISGKWALEVRALDAAGNVSASSESSRLVVNK